MKVAPKRSGAAGEPGDGSEMGEGEPQTPGRAPQVPRGKKPFHFWRLVGTMSSLGWSLVLPIVGGALLGNYLDRVTGKEYVWTVGLLFAGVAMSLYNLYHVLFKETMD